MGGPPRTGADEVAAMLGYRPSYIKWLCDTKRLGYVVKSGATGSISAGVGSSPMPR
jgi:hypothetical protein